MNAEYFEKLMEWQKGKPTRSMTLEFKFNEPCNIWVFDSELAVGDFLDEGEIPDLEARAEIKARAEYERLKTKFEGEK